MTGLEYVMVAMFASIGLVPLGMAVAWERRLARSRREPRASSPPAAPSGRHRAPESREPAR